MRVVLTPSPSRLFSYSNHLPTRPPSVWLLNTHTCTRTLQASKNYFGYIYGFGAIGCLTMYTILNLMTEHVAIDGSRVFSVLGYSMLPITVLSAIRIVLDLRWVQHGAWSCGCCPGSPSALPSGGGAVGLGGGLVRSC